MTGADLLKSAHELVRVQSRYAARGIGLAQAALAGAASPRPLRHYPVSDVVDVVHGSQMYYHAHRSAGLEHGHFHLFQRHADGGCSHLAALSLDERGWPLRWFATNRWVTGERWQSAAANRAALAHWQIRSRGRLAPVARWVTAMVHLHRAELERLCSERDAALQRLAGPHQAEHVLEDRQHDVLAEVPVDLASRLGTLAEAERLAARNTPTH